MKLTHKRDDKGQVVLIIAILVIILLVAVFGGLYISHWVWLVLIALVIVALLSRDHWYHRGPPTL